MKIVEYPTKEMAEKLLQRPTLDKNNLKETIVSIFDDVKRRGDKALRYYSKMFDGINPESFRVSEKILQEASKKLPQDLKDAMKVAASNIEKFHFSQKPIFPISETSPGISCWTEARPIEKVGLYIPGGSAPLFSSVLMLGIPATIAGCQRIVITTPPDSNGEVHPAILFAASLAGIQEIYSIGGAQAIAALSLGTGSIPAVDKIFGPGNQYVTLAKEWAQWMGTAIDMPAGPSEVLVIADGTANPEFIAADLIAQAEHGPDSQVILLTNDPALPQKCLKALESQIKTLPREAIIKQALENSSMVLLPSLTTCIEWSNWYAPEHLIIASDQAKSIVPDIKHAGSVFLGHYSCESAGDYASGTNHTLPTNGYARQYSGVSVDSFIRKITFQNITKEGLENLAPTIEAMALAEGLHGHNEAVKKRLQN